MSAGFDWSTYIVADGSYARRSSARHESLGFRLDRPSAWGMLSVTAKPVLPLAHNSLAPRRENTGEGNEGWMDGWIDAYLIE